MEGTAEILFTIGCLFFLGLATDFLGRRSILPRVTLLLLFGILIGHEGLDLIPAEVTGRFELIGNIALLMIGFLLGSKLTADTFRKSGPQMLWISICAAMVTAVLVTLGLALVGVPLEVAVLLGCISSATAPAATTDVLIESGAKGPFANLLQSIVALDDAWALLVFSFGMAAASVITGADGLMEPVLAAVKEIGLAVILGLLIGFPAAYITGRVRSGQPMLTEALGLVLICGGLAMWLEVSFLIASMVMGAVIANVAQHHEYPFHEIENIEWPFMILFFVLAGAILELSSLKEIGVIGLVYIACRSAGKVLGSRLGAGFSHADLMTRKWMGASLLPQAGAAMGMALLAANRYPEHRQVLLSVIISTTVVFEVIGPVFTRLALQRSRCR